MVDGDQAARNEIAAQLLEIGRSLIEDDEKVFAVLRPGDQDASRELATMMRPVGEAGYMVDLSADDQRIVDEQVRQAYILD